MREICLDTETTGLDPRSGHKIVEIACVELIDKVKSGKIFHTYVNPRRDIPIEATNVHGLTIDFLEDKPIFDHVAQEFLDFIGDAKLVIHNAAFDLKFLNHELRAVNRGIITNEIADSLLIARRKFPGSPNSLDALCRRFSIDLSKRDKHSAILDTELLCDVYVELMGGLQSGFGFSNEDEEDGDGKPKIIPVKTADKKTITERDFPLSEEDLELHKKFIAEHFKDNLWGY